MSKSRFLLLNGACQRAIRVMFSIMQALSQEAGDKSAGRLKLLTDVRTLFMMHLIPDAYGPIALFNTINQDPNTTISQTPRLWRQMFTQINWLKVKPL